MKPRHLFVLAAMLMFATTAACSSAPSTSAIQTAIAQTQTPAAVKPILTPSTSPSPAPTPKPKVSCPDSEVKTYLKELDLLLEEFDDTTKVAESTSRIGLAPVMANMQSQKRSIRRLVAPDCAKYLTDLVVVAVETHIDAFLSFMSQQSDTSVSRKITAAKKVRTTVDEQVETFRKNPIAAYESASLSAESLVLDFEQTGSANVS